MKKYVRNPLTNRYIEVGKYKYRRLIKGGVIKPYVDDANKKYEINTDEYIKFLKYKKDTKNDLGKSKNKNKINLKKNDEKIEQKNNINLNIEHDNYQYKDKKEEVYQYNNKEEKDQEKEHVEKTVEKLVEKPVEKDLEVLNFDDELEKLIALEMMCPSTDSESEED